MKTLDDVRLTEEDRKAIQATALLLRERFPLKQLMLPIRVETEPDGVGA